MRYLAILLILFIIAGCDQPEESPVQQVKPAIPLKKKVIKTISKIKKKRDDQIGVTQKSPVKKKHYQKMIVSRFGWAYPSKKLYQKVSSTLVTVQFYVEFGAFSKLPEGYKSFFNEEANTFALPGILVGKNQVLTIYSIIRDASVIFLKDHEGTLYLDVKGVDEEFNLVLLEGKRPIKGYRVLTMPKRDRRFLQGQQLYTLGSPHLLHQSFWRSELNLLHYSPFYNVVTTLFSEATTPIARAGSAVFNRRGGFCGIVSLYDPYFEHSGMVVTANVLKKVLPKLKKGYSITNQGWIGLYLKQDGDQVSVKKTIPGGPAEIGGIHPGDQIISVNRIAVKGKHDIRGMMKFLRPKNRVLFHLKRGDQYLDVELQAVVKPLKYQVSNQNNQQEQEQRGLGLQWRLCGEGIELEEIENGSLGFIHGFKKGDRLIALNQRPITTIEGYHMILKEIPRDTILQFKVSRRNTVRFIAVKKP